MRNITRHYPRLNPVVFRVIMGVGLITLVLLLG